jgi:hypothetical protein
MDDNKIKLVPSVFSAPNQVGDFGWMIQRSEYSDGLFIFNDNQEAFYTKYKRKGGGNAIIRPYRYKNPKRAVGVPTGTKRGGYKQLTPFEKRVIDDAIAEIKSSLDAGNYKRVFYSAESDGKTLGTSIFVVNEDVKKYIVSELQKLVDSY